MFRLKTVLSMRSTVLTALVSLCMCSAAVADTIVLKDGTVLQGTFRSGTSSEIVFESKGKANTYAVEAIVSLTFQRTPPASSTPSTQPAETDNSAAPAPVTVSAGTRLMIRTDSPLNSGGVQANARFTAKLEAALVSGGVTAAPKGATVYGRVVEAVKAKRIRGRAKLVIELTDVMLGDVLHPVVTDQLEYEGGRSGVLKKIVAGAAIGSVADGSDGAKTGAAVGAGVAVLTTKRQIEIPAGALLEFRLLQPLVVRP